MYTSKKNWIKVVDEKSSMNHSLHNSNTVLIQTKYPTQLDKNDSWRKFEFEKLDSSNIF